MFELVDPPLLLLGLLDFSQSLEVGVAGQLGRKRTIVAQEEQRGFPDEPVRSPIADAATTRSRQNRVAPASLLVVLHQQPGAGIATTGKEIEQMPAFLDRGPRVGWLRRRSTHSPYAVFRAVCVASYLFTCAGRGATVLRFLGISGQTNVSKA
jgi:hypothetical protein